MAERPVVENAKRDICLYGRPLSHPFLVLENPAGEIVSDIHGHWMNGAQGALRTRIGYRLNSLTSVAQDEGKVFSLARRFQGQYPIAVVECRDRRSKPAVYTVNQKVFEGPRKKAMDIWQALQDRFPAVNEQSILYYRYAGETGRTANCQTMLKEVWDRAGVLKDMPRPGLLFTATAWSPARSEL